MSEIRRATYAYRGWYPADPQELTAELDRHLAGAGPGPARPVRGLVSPHAGYRYCGGVAGATWGRVAVPEVALVLGLNHGHPGAPYATQRTGAWEVPGSQVPIHQELATRVLAGTTLLTEDPEVLAAEHSLEMQLPWLWRRRPDVRLVPIQLGFLTLPELVDLGEQLAEVIAGFEAATGERVLLVASTDLHHQEQPPTARDDLRVRRLDELASERLLAGDPAGLFRTVREHDIGMCGVVPVAVALVAARRLGATRVEQVAHATSAEIPPHNYSYVVGYGGFLLSE
ncbi:MAG: AmmeMemoRadiSam system protein B [Myxococcota bacterium]|jgi:AmmeMemoRadiSam system protein B|nr:AmmeMemoRadiSam system protein B [Myxococcota bacterium]